MILVDSDHLSVLLEPRDLRSFDLQERLEAFEESVALPIVVVEEKFRAWLAEIRRVNNVHRQINAYTHLARAIEFLADWQIVGWDKAAADQFKQLRADGIRIGTQDLKIASIALATNSMLLTANTRDFDEVPGLATEDWLH